MSLLTLPGRILRGAWRFVNPPQKAGRIPFTRTVVAILAAGAAVFVGYTMVKKAILLPFAPEPYVIEVELTDAKGLDELDEPAAGVAGSPSGRVVDVRHEDGIAVATLRLDSDLRGKIFADASAAIRPVTALQNLAVNVDAGDPKTGPLPDGARIEADRTEGFVAIDELTSMLDADTQAMTQILLREAARGLGGREPQLRASLLELGELTETATPVSEALADRRRLLSRLVDHLDTVFATLARRGTQLADTIDAGSRTLAVTAEREPELAAATRELAPTLLEARSAIDAGGELARTLNPALDELLGVAGRIEGGSRKLRELIPPAERFLELSASLAEEGRRPVRLLRDGTEGLTGRLEGVAPTVDELAEQTRLLDKYKEGLAQTGDLLSGALSTNDSGGTLAQIDNVAFDAPTAENLGLEPGAARARGKRPSQLSVMLAAALERTCRTTNSVGCVLRYAIPDLPLEPVLEPREQAGAEDER